MSQSPELEEDIRKLHGLVAAAEAHYEEMEERYFDLPGWLFLRSQMCFAMGMPEVLLGVMPENYVPDSHPSESR